MLRQGLLYAALGVAFLYSTVNGDLNTVECDSSPIDITFLFDETPTNESVFEVQKQKVLNVIRHLESSTKGRSKFYSLIAFGRSPISLLELASPFSGSAEKLVQQLSLIRPSLSESNETSVAKAMEKAAKELMEDGHPNSKRLVFLVHNGVNTDLVAETLEAVSSLQKQEAVVFGMDGDADVNTFALQGYSGDTHRVLSIDSDITVFNAAIDEATGACMESSIENSSAEDIAKAKEVQTRLFSLRARDDIRKKRKFSPDQLCSQEKIDLMIVLDTSGSVFNAFKEERQFAIDLIESLKDEAFNQNVQVSIIRFSAIAENLVPFQMGRSKEEILKTLKEIPFTGQNTRIASAVNLGVDELEKHQREDARQFFILISDGHGQEYWNVVQSTGKKLQETDWEVFSVTASRDFNFPELMLYTGDDERVFVGAKGTSFLPTVTQLIDRCLSNNGKGTSLTINNDDKKMLKHEKTALAEKDSEKKTTVAEVKPQSTTATPQVIIMEVKPKKRIEEKLTDSTKLIPQKEVSTGTADATTQTTVARDTQKESSEEKTTSEPKQETAEPKTETAQPENKTVEPKKEKNESKEKKRSNEVTEEETTASASKEETTQKSLEEIELEGSGEGSGDTGKTHSETEGSGFEEPGMILRDETTTTIVPQMTKKHEKEVPETIVTVPTKEEKKDTIVLSPTTEDFVESTTPEISASNDNETTTENIVNGTVEKEEKEEEEVRTSTDNTTIDNENVTKEVKEVETTPSTTTLSTTPSEDETTEKDTDCDVDVILLVDRSQSVDEDFKKEIKTAVDTINLATHNDYDSGKVRVGAVSFARDATVELPLQKNSRENITEAIRTIFHTGGTTSAVTGFDTATRVRGISQKRNHRKCVDNKVTNSSESSTNIVSNNTSNSSLSNSNSDNNNAYNMKSEVSGDNNNTNRNGVEINKSAVSMTKEIMKNGAIDNGTKRKDENTLTTEKNTDIPVVVLQVITQPQSMNKYGWTTQNKGYQGSNEGYRKKEEKKEINNGIEGSFTVEDTRITQPTEHIVEDGKEKEVKNELSEQKDKSDRVTTTTRIVNEENSLEQGKSNKPLSPITVGNIETSTVSEQRQPIIQSITQSTINQLSETSINGGTTQTTTQKEEEEDGIQNRETNTEVLGDSDKNEIKESMEETNDEIANAIELQLLTEAPQSESSSMPMMTGDIQKKTDSSDEMNESSGMEETAPIIMTITTESTQNRTNTSTTDFTEDSTSSLPSSESESSPVTNSPISLSPSTIHTISSRMVSDRVEKTDEMSLDPFQISGKEETDNRNLDTWETHSIIEVNTVPKRDQRVPEKRSKYEGEKVTVNSNSGREKYSNTTNFTNAPNNQEKENGKVNSYENQTTTEVTRMSSLNLNSSDNSDRIEEGSGDKVSAKDTTKTTLEDVENMIESSGDEPQKEEEEDHVNIEGSGVNPIQNLIHNVVTTINEDSNMKKKEIMNKISGSKTFDPLQIQKEIDGIEESNGKIQETSSKESVLIKSSIISTNIFQQPFKTLSALIEKTASLLPRGNQLPKSIVKTQKTKNIPIENASNDDSDEKDMNLLQQRISQKLVGNPFDHSNYKPLFEDYELRIDEPLQPQKMNLPGIPNDIPMVPEKIGGMRVDLSNNERNEKGRGGISHILPQEDVVLPNMLNKDSMNSEVTHPSTESRIFSLEQTLWPFSKSDDVDYSSDSSFIPSHPPSSSSSSIPKTVPPPRLRHLYSNPALFNALTFF